MTLKVIVFLVMAVVRVAPVVTQTENNQNEWSSEIPRYKLLIQVWYNTTTPDQVSQACGEHYAMTFLENFIRTENAFQMSCDLLPGDRVLIRHSVMARVRLFGPAIELSTHINISVEDPKQFASENDATPSAPFTAGRHVWQGQDDILGCMRFINQSLSNPVTLQEEYNDNHLDSIDLLRINGNGCLPAQMEPIEIKIREGKWTCPNNEDYIYDGSTWECIHRSEYTTTTDITPIFDILTTTTSTTTTITSNVLTTSSENDLPTEPPVPTNPTSTETPQRQPWELKFLNISGSLTMTEGDDPRPVTFVTTVNRTHLCAGASSCVVRIQITITNSKKALPRCRSTGDAIPQLVLAEPPQGSPIDKCSLTLDISGDQSDEYVFTRTIHVAPLLDMKYDGVQRRKIALSVTSEVDGNEGPTEKSALTLSVYVQDMDRKATCKSINDPHIITFDGFEYNNFYEGEFILYQHTTLPYKVHVIYQKCSPGVLASCNCAVAVQSGDDVIVIDRCYRDKAHFNRIRGQTRTFTRMSVDLYLNGNLTPGTTIYEEADGKRYVIYLPHGAYVKVMVSGALINVWIVASPRDAYSTEGLCGTNDMLRNNDLQLRNGSIFQTKQPPMHERLHPDDFCLDWRVDLFGKDSLFRGVPEMTNLEASTKYCDCTSGRHLCGYAVDISTCDVLQGVEFTHLLMDMAKPPELHSDRQRRSVYDNVIGSTDEPIAVDPNFIPPVHSWDTSQWQYSSAQDYCNAYVRDQYNVGQLCAQIPAVDFNQEIQTCIEDIKITGNTSWADAARDAMKEQCIEEVQRNGSVPSDIANAIQNAICINDCSGHGHCKNGTCICDNNWHSADCSLTMDLPPYSSDMPVNGLCDTRFMRCDRVIVYGDDFIRGPNLTCHFQECEVNEDPYQFRALLKFFKSTALFINFNAVECSLPHPKTKKSYLVSVSNDGVFDHASDPLLFLPFDSACYSCSTNSTSCTKRTNSCKIDGKCYLENERSPNDDCLICKPFAHDLQWTTDAGSHCRSSWWDDFKIPTWVIALVAALGGSLLGVLIGFLLYKCCCKQEKPKEEHSSNDRESTQEDSDALPYHDVPLHRNANLPLFTDDRFMDYAFRSPEVEETYFQHNNHAAQNGIDSATYF